jgi:hypothetical protein
MNHLIDKYIIFLGKDREEAGGTKEIEIGTQAPKRSKYSRPMLSTLLQLWPKCTGADANKVLDELDVYLKEPLATNEEGEFDLSFSPQY